MTVLCTADVTKPVIDLSTGAIKSKGSLNQFTNEVRSTKSGDVLAVYGKHCSSHG